MYDFGFHDKPRRMFFVNVSANAAVAISREVLETLL
jgi:hypothetical protein